MEIKNITVLGSGIMGHGIAQVSAMAGYNVILRDIEQKFLDKAIEKIKWSLDKLVSKEKISENERDDIFSRIKPIVDLKDAVHDCDLVIEAVPEIMDLKKKVYAELDKAAGEQVIFASNTSTLPITEIANTISRPKKFIGIHFFNPPQLMKLVEVIPGQETSDEITNLTINFVKSVNKVPVTCRKDVPGFIVNRLFIPLVHEACYVMERQKIQKTEIDSAVKFNLGFPMGILELADFTGLDVKHKATLEMHVRDKKVILPHATIEQLFNEKISCKECYNYNPWIAPLNIISSEQDDNEDDGEGICKCYKQREFTYIDTDMNNDNKWQREREQIINTKTQKSGTRI